jgi:hypothetical protein
MSIQLKLQHEEGIRLRQQQSQEVTRSDDGSVQGKPGKEWKFVRFTDNNGHQVEDVQQDEDARLVGNDGKKLKTGFYTIHITAGIRNLVLERKGKVAPFNFKNPAIRNQVRVKYQTLEKTGRKTATGKDVHEWRDSGLPQYHAPNSFMGVFIGDNTRAVIDEMPT